ncbi:hypothetical protein KRX57_04550 [Weeksellaceae bacterium TAE3-ERU29]|nr:hypothetical protein [Weeksellaceae bacterium TAE3-ERU29]
MEKTQVKSRKRVADHGEVFTNEREVNAMLDLVKDQVERIDATFLEPACGSGNFLIEILNRRILILKDKYKKDKILYDTHLIKSVSSIYGVELLEDNAIECRNRLFEKVGKDYPKAFKTSGDYPHLMKSIRHILNKNIVCGDALKYTTLEGTPLVFTEWKFINSTQVKRRCFDYQVVLEDGKQLSIFGEDNQIATIPEHNTEYPPTHYLKLYTDE